MYLQHLSSLQFLTLRRVFRGRDRSRLQLLPGKAPPMRDEPYSEEELGAHDRKLAKYFVAGGVFLVLGSAAHGGQEPAVDRRVARARRATRAISSATCRTRT